MELVHGGDWAGYRARFGHDALDFSANVSPLGLPQGVVDAIVAALPTADRYPDPLCRELRTALSRAEQLPEPWILCGNGAADLIYRLVWAVLVVDECFLDFLQQRDALTAKPLLQAAPNLVILKAFTKLYAMAGVRLGYALCANTALLAKMQAAGQPWGVSSLAQAAGAAALREAAYADAVRALIADQRPKLAAGDRGQRQLPVVPCAGNAGRGAAAAGRLPAQLRQLPGAERRLVPHRRAHRAGKRTVAADHAGGTKMSKATCIMVQGTMSGAGKSLLCAALCRIFAQDGWRVAPFKSQNMALNSFVTRDGLEMGRAQVVQAQAAGVEPDVRMNPILLKPSSDIGSQVIVNGEVRGQMPAAEYFRRKKQLIPDILAAYNSLAEDFDIIVIEGAGSPAEINLKADDIVNMGLAKLVDAPVLLVGDIDRGGVFAQLFGTVELLEPDERARIKGLIINKFRGDVGILRPGLAMLEEKTHLPVFGVVPYLKADIEDEDSLSDRLQVKNAVKPLDAAIVRLPHISNFTDFMPLEQHPLLGVRYVQTTRELGAPDCVILPGTKNTVDDLLWLRQCGLEAAISKLAQRGTPVLGVCGGYQMLGQTLADPEGTESGRPQTLRGLGLLPTQTTFAAEKRRTQSQATVTAEPFAGAHLTGYEIHTGRTTVQGAPLCTLADGTPEGCVQGQVFGTYLHGLFDSGELTEQFAAYLCRRKGIDPAAAAPISMQEYRTQQLDLLADGVRHNLDLAAVYAAMGLAQPAERGNDQ